MILKVFAFFSKKVMVFLQKKKKVHSLMCSINFIFKILVRIVELLNLDMFAIMNKLHRSSKMMHGHASVLKQRVLIFFNPFCCIRWNRTCQIMLFFFQCFPLEEMRIEHRKFVRFVVVWHQHWIVSILVWQFPPTFSFSLYQMGIKIVSCMRYHVSSACITTQGRAGNFVGVLDAFIF